MRRIFFFIILFYIPNLFGQNNTYTTLCTYMTGSFSSEMQSKSDTDYYDIRLHMTHIWQGRTDGYWLYVEQAVAEYSDKPYRQRMYQVIQINNNTFESRVYEFENPLQYAGAWKEISKIDSLTFEKLQVREGCEIVLTWDVEKNKFIGQTGEKSCSSNLRGASYATSEVMISADKLISWDRGWNENDEQVWGAEKGGYIFIKQSE